MDTHPRISPVPDVVYATDAEGCLTSVSQSSGLVLGYRPDELVGRSMFDLVHPEDRAGVRAAFEASVRHQDGDVRTLEVRLMGKDGGTRHCELHPRLIWDGDILAGSEGIARDVTEQRRLEERLRLYRAIITASRDAVAIYDGEGRYLEQNPAHEQLLGYSTEELRGRTPAIHAGEQGFSRIAASLVRSGSFRGEVESRAKDGRAIHCELSAFSVRGEEGRVECHVGFARDITARKREESRRQVFQRLRESILLMRGEQDIDRVLVTLGEGLRSLGLEYQNCGINLLDTTTDPPGMRSRSTKPGGGWIESDTPRAVLAVHRMWQRGEPTYRPDLEADDPFQELPYLQTHARIRAVVDVPFSQGTLALNSTRPHAFSGEDLAVLQELADVLSAGFQRIDDLRRLALSEQRYRTLLETPDFVVLLLDPSGNYVYVTPRVREWLGLSPEDFYADPKLGQRIVHPDDWAAASQAFARGVDGQVVEGVEFRWRRRDGSYRWASQGVYPICAEDGSVHTVQVVIHDITGVKEAVAQLQQANRELLQTQARLVQSEKMAALGNLVAGIAHEINTPVGAIHSMHDTLVRAVDRLKATIAEHYPECCCLDSPLARALKAIEDSNRVIETGSQRVTKIVRSLRNFARLDQAERKEADLHEGLDDSLMLIHHDIKGRIEVVRDYGDIPAVVCYPGRLNQVFLNILNNAQQAIPEKGTITIATRRVGDEVRVAISDTGVGIPADRLSRIFDPGYTTKGVGVGTGLGLSICYQIMADHGGRIDVTSQVGRGSTFAIAIPIAPPAAPGAGP